jgi:hypothetical protein
MRVKSTFVSGHRFSGAAHIEGFRVCVRTHHEFSLIGPGSLTKDGCPHTPGFPVKFVGVDELHAAFLDESRTRGHCLVPRTGNPGISLVFREMWDTTVVDR